jgi:CDP-diacylglycerol---serine O-phosphatidyltransferase
MTSRTASISGSPLSAIHMSNLLTYLALSAGLAAIGSAVHGSAGGAGAFLALAALADTFDGRFARLFARDRHTEAMGAELDSLSDAVAFGVAPVAAVSLLLPVSPGWNGMFWWLAAVAYVGSAVTRLAHYNVSAVPSSGFVGLPAPVAALAWSTVLIFAPDITAASLVALMLGVAMIAPLKIGRPGAAGLTVFALWPLILLVVHWGRA